MNLKVFGRTRSGHNQVIIPELAETEENADKSQWGNPVSGAKLDRPLPENWHRNLPVVYCDWNWRW